MMPGTRAFLVTRSALPPIARRTNA